MKKLFTDHPHSVGETYFAHFKFAIYIGLNLMLAGVIYIVHAFLPFLFTKTGSSILIEMSHRIISRRPGGIEGDVADLYSMMEHKKANPRII